MKWLTLSELFPSHDSSENYVVSKEITEKTKVLKEYSDLFWKLSLEMTGDSFYDRIEAERLSNIASRCYDQLIHLRDLVFICELVHNKSDRGFVLTYCKTILEGIIKIFDSKIKSIDADQFLFSDAAIKSNALLLKEDIKRIHCSLNEFKFPE